MSVPETAFTRVFTVVESNIASFPLLRKRGGILDTVLFTLSKVFIPLWRRFIILGIVAYNFSCPQCAAYRLPCTYPCIVPCKALAALATSKLAHLFRSLSRAIRCKRGDNPLIKIQP